jgi:hypothetical protein
MSDARADAVAREAAAWEVFNDALGRIPRERWEEPGVLPGWTVKDLLWHVAGWLRTCAEDLEAMAAGRFVEDDDADDATDVRNAELAAEARDLSVEAVWSGVLEARELVLRRWAELPEVDSFAAEELASESYEHYEEHVPDLERFVG